MNKNTEIIDVGVSIRLMNVCKMLELKTIGDLEEWYKNLSLEKLPKNMGKKSLTEVEQLLSSDTDGQFVNKVEKLKNERVVTNLKNLVKQLHKEMFYTEDYDINKLLNISSKLTKHIKRELI